MVDSKRREEGRRILSKTTIHPRVFVILSPTTTRKEIRTTSNNDWAWGVQLGLVNWKGAPPVLGWSEKKRRKRQRSCSLVASAVRYEGEKRAAIAAPVGGLDVFLIARKSPILVEVWVDSIDR